MNKVFTLLAGITIGAVIMSYYDNRTNNEVKYYSDGPVIMWNDDWESIPSPGELVEVEEVTMDTVYVGPIGE